MGIDEFACEIIDLVLDETGRNETVRRAVSVVAAMQPRSVLCHKRNGEVIIEVSIGGTVESEMIDLNQFKGTRSPAAVHDYIVSTVSACVARILAKGFTIASTTTRPDRSNG